MIAPPRVAVSRRTMTMMRTSARTVVAAKKKSNLPENLRLPASLLVAHKRRKQVPALMQPHELRQNRRALCKLIGAYINAEAGRALSTMTYLP